MANAELNVILSADGKQLAATMAKAEKDVQGLENELKDLPKAFEGVDKSVTKTATALKNATSSTDKLTKGIKLSDEALKKLQPSSNASAQSLLNLGRVAQDAPFGILGIANNINPLLESFQRLQKETGSTKTALKSLVSGLTGAGGLGLAVSVVSSLLIVFGDKLFGTKEASKASEEALRSFGEALESVKDNVKALSEELQFANQLGGINVKIRGAGDLQDLIEQSVAQQQHTVDLQNEFKELLKVQEGIANNSELNAKDRIEAEQNVGKEIKALTKEIGKSAQDQSIIYRRIALQRLEDQKEANKKAKDLSDKAFENLIKQAKAAEKFINERTIRFANFEIDPTESRQETVKKARQFIQDVFGDLNKLGGSALSNRSTFIIKTLGVVDGIDIKPTQKYFQDQRNNAAKMLADLQEEVNKISAKNKILIKATAGIEREKARGAEFFQALGIGGADENAPRGLLTNAQKAAVNLANTVRQSVIPAFDSLFNAILSGQNPLKSFFDTLIQSVQQLIQKLLSAVVQALFLSAITGGKANFGKALSSILGFKAEGGPVFANKPYVVGERGPELFIPQGGGRIIPNNEMNSGLSGVTGGSMHITVDSVISGRNLRLVTARQGQYNNRNV